MILLWASVGSLGVFFLSTLYTSSPLIVLDQWAYHVAQSFQTPALVGVFSWITFLGDPIGILAVSFAVVSMLALRKNLKGALFTVAAILSSVHLHLFLKILFARARPTELASTLGIFDSFPSGHATMTSALVCIVIFLLWDRLRRTSSRVSALVIGGVVIAAVSISRVYLGYHWLTDVVGGVALGVAWTSLIFLGFRLHFEKGLKV